MGVVLLGVVGSTSALAAPAVSAAAPPCSTRIAFRHVPKGVIFSRHGQRLGKSADARALELQAGDQIQVLGPGPFFLSFGGNEYRSRHGIFYLSCRSERIGQKPTDPATTMLLLRLKQGVIAAKAGLHARSAAVLTPEMLAFATHKGGGYTINRDPRARWTHVVTYHVPMIIVRSGRPWMRVALQPTYTGISDRSGISLNVWPFPLSALQRPVRTSDHLPEYWDNGAYCATGCGGGYVPGWPLKPFHEQHAIRAGIDEIRPANLHVAVDIQANNNQPVYPIQSGYAEDAETGSYDDTKVTVGRFTYWHIAPTVASGQWVTAYKTMIGRVENGFGHVAFEELGDNNYLNPLRPGGPLQPYHDSVAPVIGNPDIYTDGRVIVPAFDPQSFVHRQSYLTPVLALAGLAWRLYNAKGQPLTGLEWALRATGYLSPSLKPVIFAPGSYNPGYQCFATQFICKPNWVYNLAGGLTEPLPFGSMPNGRYRLSVYAWDFKGNESALDDTFSLPLKESAATRRQAEFGPLDARFDP